MEFCEKVLQARAQLMYSQEQLARELGVSFATINRWENENTKPSKVMVIRFEQFCNSKGINFLKGEENNG